MVLLQGTFTNSGAKHNWILLNLKISFTRKARQTEKKSNLAVKPQSIPPLWGSLVPRNWTKWACITEWPVKHGRVFLVPRKKWLFTRYQNIKAMFIWPCCTRGILEAELLDMRIWHFFWIFFLLMTSGVDPVSESGYGSGALGSDLWKIFKIPSNELSR